MAHVPEIFELRSASMTLVAVVLKSVDLASVAGALHAELGESPGVFSDDAVMIDLSQVDEAGRSAPVDFEALVALLRSYGMQPVAVRGGGSAQIAAALKAGLVEAPTITLSPSERRREPAVITSAPVPTPEVAGLDAARRAGAAEDTPGATPAEPGDLPAPEATLGAEGKAALQQALSAATVVVDRPLRSGQQVYAKGGDLVVLAAVNNGAEVIADGSIHVYAPLRGRAVAGAKGDTTARIYSTCLDAELISIAGTYRTTENPLPADVVGKPAQIRLEGERLVFEPLG